MDDASRLHRAAELIVSMRRPGRWLEALPRDCQPRNLADALAVQEAAIARLGEPVAGWKSAISMGGEVTRGAVLASRVWPHPAHIPAALVPLLGIETEIAFRFTRDVPPREAAYSRAEVEDAVVAFMAVEIVDSRFRSYRDAPLLDRTADFMSNGGVVIGSTREDWRTLDLSTLDASLTVDGKAVVQGRAAHPAGHPLLPALALVNVLRSAQGVQQGQFITTGTYTGLNFVTPGRHVIAALGGFGEVDLTLTT